MIAVNVEEQELKLTGALISEVFHSLSQPLTALHCELELALRRGLSLATLDEELVRACKAAGVGVQ